MRKVTILTSINEPGILIVITAALRADLSGKYEFHFTEVQFTSELVHLAETQPPDLFILLLNNLFVDTKPSSAAVQEWPPLQVLFSLQALSGKPLVTLSCWVPTTFERIRRAGQGGAMLLTLPSEREAFVQAVDECLANQ
jgi:hypothetical protein